MEIGSAIFQHLSSSTGVTAYTSQRIYPMFAPQGAAQPYVTFLQVSELPVHAMSADPKLTGRRFQVSSWSTSYAQVDALAKQVRVALRDHMGMLGDGTSGVNVQRIFFEGRQDLSDIDPETGAITYHVPQDFMVWHTT